RMARLVVLLLASCLWVSGYTQFSATQVSWDTEWEKMGNAQYRLIFNATIEEGWHIFSQYSPEGGSQPAFFEFLETDVYKRIGPVIEPTPEAYYNDVFEVTEQIFKDEVRFEQLVEVYDLSKPIEITLYYQVCKELCISASEDFVFQIGQPSSATAKESVAEARDDLKLALDLKLDLKNEHYLESIGVEDESLNIWSLALLGFLGGLIALLTPCVLPIIPLTVSYFNQKKNTTT
ncbi:MAG: protein-disulfide reductase DsbD domain-containing protein, partial [Flavobacteriaceae bacterium]